MHLAKVEKTQEVGSFPLEFSGMVADRIQVLRSGKRVGVFYGGFCYASFLEGDKFSRNFCLVQLHVSGRVKLKELANIFGVGYQQCSNIVARFRKSGVEGLLDLAVNSAGNREIIDEGVGEFILKLRREGKTYEDISQAIRFKFKKKVGVGSLRNWVYREGRGKEEDVGAQSRELQLPIFEGVSSSREVIWSESFRWNLYAGSLVLYAMLNRSGILEVFEKEISQDESKLNTAWDVRRVILTLFFLHALRLRSVEQSKHLVVRDFSEIVGGDFFRLQWLRYAVDKIVERSDFTRAMEEYHRRLVRETDLRDDIFYTDGHFSNYYGKRPVPKGYDARRQMPFRGRNTIYLHNSCGENVYLFESPSNTSLSNDVVTLISELEKLQIDLKGKTLAFDRGGYSAKCFRYIKRHKMYFISYLKNRRLERVEDISVFQSLELKAEDGDTIRYKIYEKESRETRYGRVRIIVLLSEGGRQIPILTTNPYLKAEQVVYWLSRRWREENCFKYMIEHFGVDLLTTYKTEAAPDKVITRPHPRRAEINRLISDKKSELESLQKELGKKVASHKSSDSTIGDFLVEEKALSFAVKNAELELGLLQIEREKIPTKEKNNLRDDHVIIAQKRRLLINAIKALNYNAEKWLQKIFNQFHAKQDETLSLIRSLFRQPGEVMWGKDTVEVRLKALDSGGMRRTLTQVLDYLRENNCLRLPDGRLLTIIQTP